MQLTTRGWWLFFLAVLLVAVGLAGAPLSRLAAEALGDIFALPSRSRLPPLRYYHHIPVLILTGLALLAWFLGQWLLFALRARLARRRLSAARLVRDEHGPVDRFWAGHTFRVRVELRLAGGRPLPYLAADDRVPFGVDLAGGDPRGDGPLRPDEPLVLSYRIRCPVVGRVHFDGVRVRLADLSGLFYQQLFIPAPADFRVMPVLTDDLGQPSTEKRHNLLPPPGIHRLHRAGSGSELLDLRDYLPGDPPRTIAWKVSARRDKLITKEFESEVPLRCTLFVDTSNSVRLGLPGRNALARVVTIAAAVTQANAAVRDLTGICLFDEQGVSCLMRPARTKRHVAAVINRLTDAAVLPPTAGAAPLEPLLRVAYPFAEETYPELMADAVNKVPFWLAWDWPVRRHLGRPRTTGARVGFAVAWGVGSLLYLGLTALVYGLVEALYDSLPETMRPPADYVFYTFLLSMLLGYLPFVRFLVYGLPALLGARARRLARWRKRLAALLALKQGPTPGGLGLLLEDNERFGLALQRFLADHQVPYQLPLYDDQGRYLYAAPGKVGVLARALLQAVGKGHDNELFVLLADLLELGDRLEPLLAAVRVALARHHHVVLICPWPEDVPPPPAAPPDDRRVLARLLAGRPLVTPRWFEEIRPVMQRALTARLHREFHRVRQAFARLGVPVVNAQSDESVAVVLERLERLRGYRSRRR